MHLPKDFREFLQSLNAHSVEYVVVGGVAVAHHGYPRLTGDLDVLVAGSHENAVRVLAALADFGAPVGGLKPEDFAVERFVFQIGVAPLRLDILTSIDGVPTHEVLQRSIPTEADGEPLRMIALPDLLRNKRTTGRPKDKADLAVLENLPEPPQHIR